DTGRKIVSIGMRQSRGVASHGFALNVEGALMPWNWAVACGMPEVDMTSLERELGEVSMDAVRPVVAAAFEASWRCAWTGGDRAVPVGAEGEDRAVRGGSRAAPHKGHSPNTSIAVWQNAFRSSGLRLVTSLFGPASQVTTSSSTQVAPALRRSVRRLGQDVSVRPRTTSASISVHGAWQMAATGLPSWKNALAN